MTPPNVTDMLVIDGCHGEGRFLTGPLTLHSETNIHVIERFMGPCFKVTKKKAGSTLVEYKKGAI